MEDMLTSKSASSQVMQQDMMDLDIATYRKRRCKATLLNVSKVRRSVRATRYMGFKALSMAELKKKTSHV